MLLSDDAVESDARVLNEANALLKGGFDVSFLVWNRFGRKHIKKWNGLEIKTIPLKVPRAASGKIMFPLLWFFNMLLFLEVLKTKCDIIYCHDFDTLPAGVLGGKTKRRKILYDSHEIYPLMVQQYLATSLSRIVSIVEFSLAKKTDAIVTVSETFATYFKEGLGRDASVTVIINSKNSADFRKSEKDNNEFRIKHGLIGKFIVLYDGWLTPENGITELLTTVEFIQGKIPNIKVLICGDGPDGEKLRRIVKDKKIEDFVHFEGKVASSEIPTFVSACDVLYVVYKSTNRYSYFRTPVRLYEAIAAGRPAIASNFGNSKWIVEKGNIGLLVNPEKTDELCNALLRLRYNTDLKNELGRNALDMSETFNWSLMEKRLVQLCDSL